jgi:hypothetical protein
MPRVCARESCGRRLVRKDGTPDYHRHFCGSECKNADKRERIQAMTSVSLRDQPGGIRVKLSGLFHGAGLHRLRVRLQKIIGGGQM